MIRHPLALPLAALLAATAGCAPDGPRQLPSPRLDAAAPFALDGGTRAADAPSAPRAANSFEERLRQRGAGGDTVPAATRSLRTMALTPGLIADLPRDDDWSWARRGELALAVHAPSNGPPDALVLTRQLPRGAVGGTLDADRFRLTVDAALASRWVELGSPSTPLAVALSAHLPLPSHEILEGLEMLQTPTLGRGLGYTSDLGSFSGWRWVGDNAHGTFLRLGGTRGVWGEQAPAPAAVAQILAALGLEAPGLGAGPGATRGFESAARMTLGTASRDGRGGIHLAIVCRLRPDCVARDDLARWLDSLRLPEAGALEPGGDDLPALSFAAGLLLLPADERLSLADLQAAAPPPTDGESEP